MDENNKNLEESEKFKKQAQEYLDNWKRERADFLNYKKDEARRIGEFAKFANESVILEVIELLDDLERAHQNFVKQNLGGQAAQEGLDQVLKKFHDLLKRYSVERIDTGGAFDPLMHEAVSTTEFLDPLKQGQETTPREEGGDKIEEVRAGYTMHGKVIRPARVKIIK